MFKYLLVMALIGATLADTNSDAKIEKEYKKDDGKGRFEYGYDITNGIGADESGDEKQVQGEYHYVGNDGVPVKITYTADENGYHPQGDSLPTPPPTPEAILKALKYIEEHPPKPDAKKY